MLTGRKVEVIQEASKSFIKQKGLCRIDKRAALGRPLCCRVRLNAQSFKTDYDRLVTLCIELHTDLIAIITSQFKQHHRLSIHTF